MVFNPSGFYLVVTSYRQVNVYSTINADLVETKNITNKNIRNKERFVTAAFHTIDSIERFVIPLIASSL